MRSFAAVFSLLLTLLTVASFAQAAECEALGKAVVAVAMNGKGEAKLVSATQLNIDNIASGSLEKVERLVFATSAGEIVVDTLPSYYSANQCEIKNIQITRE